MSTPPKDPLDTVGARAFLPVVMSETDVARALGLETAADGREAILSGRAGPFIRDGRRLLVRRESFLAFLAEREESPPDPSGPPSSTLPDWARERLDQEKGGR